MSARLLLDVAFVVLLLPTYRAVMKGVLVVCCVAVQLRHGASAREAWNDGRLLARAIRMRASGYW